MRRASLTPTAPHTSTSPLRRVPSETPEDEYDYTDDAGAPNSATNPKERSSELSSLRTGEISDDADGFASVAEPKTNLFEKSISGTRAKVPDTTDELEGGEKKQVTKDKQDAGLSTVPGRRQRRKRDFFRSSMPRRKSRSPDSTILRKIDLHWSRDEGGQSKRILLDACTIEDDERSGPTAFVLWQHANYENAKLDELKDLLSDLRAHGVQESEIGLSGRLINRISLVAKRGFVNGSFLNPVAIRYDMLDDSRYNKDKCSMFLSFPYFTVRKPGEHPTVFGNDSPEHPVRTLLQSRYRLNETTKRDQSQCITELFGDKLKSCIKAPHEDTAHLTRKRVGELIYVPQLWVLVMGLDRIVTVGAITDKDLHGPVMSLRDTSNTSEHNKCSFVQISFKNRGVLESQIYPIHQCASWFGLLNIHQQLRHVLKQGKEKTTPKDSPKDFQLRNGYHTLTDKTWASVQRATESGVLNVWMDTPRLPALSVLDTEGRKLSEDNGEQEFNGIEKQESPPKETATNTVYPELGPNIGTEPFLSWLVIDDFGIRDDSSTKTKVDRFLRAIYHSLSAFCERQVSTAAAVPISNTGPDAGTTVATPQHGGKSSQPVQAFINQVSGSGKPSIPVVGKTAKDVDDLTYDLQNKASGSGEIIELRVRKLSVELFNYYIPSDHDANLIPIQLYWGLLYEVIEGRQRLTALAEKIQIINRWAKRLHIGVHYEKRTEDEHGNEVFEPMTSDRAILQATMIDALGAVYNMFECAVRALRCIGAADSSSKLWQNALSYGDEACGLLEKARNRLIAETTGSAPGEGLGPVLTAEAIVIMLLERLAQGVYGSGTVDVINILEGYLEQLAIDVEKRPSRRLLKKINAFQEEVDIVKGVLQQQLKVLLDFQTCLDPKEFKRPTTPRRVRFNYEKVGIETIYQYIIDLRRNCKELCDRAKVLEDQNVRLVETLADDNSRAIFIFTFITILFLPLSFVATFFGMNVEGINPTTSNTSHFWAIGAPLTGGIFIICLVFVFAGEEVWFFLQSLPANCMELLGLKRSDRLV